MSERLSARTTKEIIKRGAKVIAPVLAVVALASCTTHNERVQAHAQARDEEATKTIESDQVPSLIMPGALITDGKVNLRRTPAKVNTNNRLMIEGNEVWDLPQEPVGIQRPVIVQNHFQVSDEDPVNWAMSYWPNVQKMSGDGLQGFGLNEDTANHLRYFIKPGQPRASLCGNELVGLTTAIIHPDSPSDVSKSGITIDADTENPALNYQVPVGLETWGSGPVKELEEKLRAQEYVEVPICDPSMHEAA